VEELRSGGAKEKRSGGAEESTSRYRGVRAKERRSGGVEEQRSQGQLSTCTSLLHSWQSEQRAGFILSLRSAPSSAPPLLRSAPPLLALAHPPLRIRWFLHLFYILTASPLTQLRNSSVFYENIFVRSEFNEQTKAHTMGAQNVASRNRLYYPQTGGSIVSGLILEHSTAIKFSPKHSFACGTIKGGTAINRRLHGPMQCHQITCARILTSGLACPYL
jgi:hypothetical protein